MNKLGLTILLLSFLSACGGTVAKNIVLTASPTRVSQKTVSDMKADTLGRLKDPGSVIWGTPTAFTLQNGATLTCLAYNAKNSYGGYVGMTRLGWLSDQQGVYWKTNDLCEPATYRGHVEHWDIYLYRQTG